MRNEIKAVDWTWSDGGRGEGELKVERRTEKWKRESSKQRKEGKMDGQVERGGNGEARDKSDKHFEL